MGMYSDAMQGSQPVSFDDRDRGSISISPDGTKIAFTYFQDGHWEIHTMNIDGSNRQWTLLHSHGLTSLHGLRFSRGTPYLSGLP